MQAITFNFLKRDKRDYFMWALYVLIVIGSIYRVYFIYQSNPVENLWGDPVRHWQQGTEALRGDPMAFVDPILFQIYVGAIGKLTLKMPLLSFFYTSILSLLLPWIWYRFFRELVPQKYLAVTAWVVFTWLPSWNGMYAYFIQETLMLPLLGAALFFTWRNKRKQTTNSFLLMVLFWTLASLTRAICIPLALVAIVWLWIVQENKFKNTVTGLLLLAMILVPLSFRSYYKTNIVAPFGNGYVNEIYAKSGYRAVQTHYRHGQEYWSWGFQSPSLDTRPFEPLSDWQSKRRGTIHLGIQLEDGAENWHAYLEKYQPSFAQYLWILKENLIFLFQSRSWPDTNRDYILGELNYQMRWIWAPFGLAIAIWTALAWRRHRVPLLLPALIAAWFVVQGLLPLSVNEGRYRKPFEGLLLAQTLVLTSMQLARRRKPRDVESKSTNSTEVEQTS